MGEFISKISAYNIFNYLLPGVLFAVLADNFTGYQFIHDDLVTGIFVYYFIGLLVSRFGSVVVETSLRKIGFLKFVAYADYVQAVKGDDKIEVLLEQNNMYRTFVSLGICLFLVKFYEVLSIQFDFENQNFFAVLALIFVSFLFSYRKQTRYIVKRVTLFLNQKRR